MKKILISLLILLSQVNHASNILNRGNGSEVDSLNIHQAQGINSHNIIRDMYEGLMTLDERGEAIYGVAKSHTTSDKTWTFELDQYKKWTNGNSVSAYDFEYAWKQALKPETAAPYSFLLTNIKNARKILSGKLDSNELGVKALNHHTLVVELQNHDNDFLEKLTLPIFYPINQQDTKLTNGPYRLHQRVLQEKIVLTKNEHYPKIENVYFDKIIYWVTENQSSELKRFRANELDITETIPDSQLPWIEEHLAESLRIFPYQGSFFLGLNLAKKPLQNLEFRKALHHAIDRKILVQKVLKSGQKPAFGLIPEVMLGRKHESIDRSQQIKIAKEYLDKSGVDPKTVKLDLLYNNSVNQRKVALAVAAMWKQVLGIKTQLKNQEWKVFTQTRKTHNKQVFRSGWIADYNSPLSFLQLFKSDSHYNFYEFENSEFDRILQNAEKAKDKQRQNEQMQLAEDIILNDLPIIPLYYYVSRHLVSKEIQGFEDNVSDRHLSKYIYKK